MLRYLRIAVTVLSLTACVLMLALWMDSYRSVRFLNTRYYRLQLMAGSFRGAVGIDVNTNQTSSGPGTKPMVYWHFSTHPSSKRNHGLVTDRLRVISFLGFRWVCTANSYEADLPFWFLTLLPAATSALPWIHWSRRFSLRTLLIATTLVALALGLVVAVA